MKVQEIENVIQWYISALKKAGIKQFAYSNGVLHLYPNELTDEQYEKCDIISEFIIIKHMVRDNENRYDIKDYLEHAESKCYELRISFPPAQVAFNSIRTMCLYDEPYPYKPEYLTAPTLT